MNRWYNSRDLYRRERGIMDGNPSNVCYQTAILVARYPRQIRYEVKSYFLWIRVLYHTAFITALGQIAGDDA